MTESPRHTQPPEDHSTPPPDLEQPADDESELVCFCMHVRAATLLRAIRLGADSVETLSDWTAAGMGCGTCRTDLSALLENGSVRREPDGPRDSHNGRGSDDRPGPIRG